MPLLIGPYYAAAVLLVGAGLPKLVRPEAMARAMSDVGLFGSPLLARALALAEVVIGTAALIAGGRVWAVLLAMAYVAFCVFLVVALSTRDAQSCGCFLGDDAPPSVLHIVLDAGFAAVCAAMAVRGVPSYLHVFATHATVAVELGVMSLVVAWLSYLLLSRMPTVRSSTATAAAEGRA